MLKFLLPAVTIVFQMLAADSDIARGGEHGGHGGDRGGEHHNYGHDEGNFQHHSNMND